MVATDRTPVRHATTPRGDYSQSPLLVFYETTLACDLVCQHCRACAHKLADPAELSTPLALSLIDQLAEFPAPPSLVLTGGDPFKRADLFELIEHAVSRALEVSITPSATPLVTSQAIGQLRDLGISRMAISVDGATAQSHDGVRGVAGSFARSLEILADARRVGIATQVNTTLAPHNLGQIEAMAELFAPLDIAMWSVFFLVPVGRAQHLPRLSATECEAAFERLWREAQRQPYAIKTTEAPHYRRFAIQHQLARSRASGEAAPVSYVSRGINDGKGVMFVNHAGLVQPSGFLPLVAGIFPQEHLVRIYQDSPIFRALRDAGRLEGKCRVCEFRHLCGGSRARALAVTGNVFAEEPDCAYVPAVFTPA
jgi:AdoMet-dependent heme synthase